MAKATSSAPPNRTAFATTSLVVMRALQASRKVQLRTTMACEPVHRKYTTIHGARLKLPLVIVTAHPEIGIETLIAPARLGSMHPNERGALHGPVLALEAEGRR